MYAQHRIGVVIPAFNEEQLIQRTISSIPEYVDRVYVIDDGSTDATPARVRELLHDLRIIYLRHDRNLGVGAAITTGYKQALRDGVDVVAVMAGDNQMDCKYLPYLLDPIVWKIADYTKGNRLIRPELRQGMSAWRSFGNSLLTYITKFSSGYYETIDPQNGYTAISRRALQKLDLDGIYPWYGYLNDLLAKLNVAGCKVTDVIIPARYGQEKSKIRYGIYIFKVSWLLAKTFLWRLYMKYFVLDFHPLIFFYIIGFFLSGIGVLSSLYSLHHKFVSGGEFFIHGMLSLILLMIGFQFMLFGIVFDIQHRQKVSAHDILQRMR